MMLPSDVNDWPELWKNLYREHVFILQLDGMSEEQARAEAEAEQRRIAETEDEQWYQNEAEADERIKAIIQKTRDRGKHARFKALGEK